MAKLTAAEQQAMMEAYLADQDMYGTLPSLSPDIQDLQGDFFTTAKQGATLAADPSFLITNQLLDPGTFSPLSSYEPVETPGASLLARWRSGNPYQQWAASQFDSGQPVSTMLAQLAKMVAQPADATQQEIISYLPPGVQYDEITGESKQTGPDLRLIGDELRGVETAVFNDPQNTVIDPTTGLPSTITTEDSPMTKKLRSLGYVSTPGDSYNPYDFAPQGVTPESDALLEEMRVRTGLQEGLERGRYQGEVNRAGRLRDQYQKLLAEPVAPLDFTSDASVPDNRAPLQKLFGMGDSALSDVNDAASDFGGRAVNAVGNAVQWPFRSGDNPADFGINGDAAGSYLNELLPAGDRDTRDWSGQPGVVHDPGMGRPDLVDYDANAARIRAKRGEAPLPGRTVAGPGVAAAPGRNSVNVGAMMRQQLGQLGGNVNRGVDLARLQAQRKAQVGALVRQQAQAAKAKGNAINSENAAWEAVRQDAMRRQMIQGMEAQGRTKFGDEVQRRMAGIYGMGR